MHNKIQYIDITIDYDIFKDNLDDLYPDHFEYEIKHHTTRKGKDMLEYIDKSEANTSTMIGSILAEWDRKSGLLHFRNFQMGQRNFCENLTKQMNGVFSHLALECMGDYLSILEGTTVYIIEGEMKRSKTAVVLESQLVPYSDGKGEQIELDENGSAGTGLQIQKPINLFLQENPELQASLQGLDFQATMNKLASELLKIRASGVITGDEFVDLYRQVGTIGITEKSLLQIYLLIKP